MLHPTKKSRKVIRQTLNELVEQALPEISPASLIEYLGNVNYATNENVLGKIKEHMFNAPAKTLTMLVTSPGGPTGTAMSFYDTVRVLLKPKLITIGSGDVDSSGLLIFLTGSKRYITPHTTLLLHPAGRTFSTDKRITAAELTAMATEDRLKDVQYATVVADNSRGQLTVDEVLELMEKHTVLTPDMAVSMGLAEAIYTEELTVS